MVNIQHLFLCIYNASLGQSAEKPVGLFCWFKMAFVCLSAGQGDHINQLNQTNKCFFNKHELHIDKPVLKQVCKTSK